MHLQLRASIDNALAMHGLPMELHVRNSQFGKQCTRFVYVYKWVPVMCKLNLFATRKDEVFSGRNPGEFSLSGSPGVNEGVRDVRWGAPGRGRDSSHPNLYYGQSAMYTSQSIFEAKLRHSHFSCHASYLA